MRRFCRSSEYPYAIGANKPGSPMIRSEVSQRPTAPSPLRVRSQHKEEFMLDPNNTTGTEDSYGEL